MATLDDAPSRGVYTGSFGGNCAQGIEAWREAVTAPLIVVVITTLPGRDSAGYSLSCPG